MPAIEHQPYTVNVWSEDELSIAQVLATAATLSIAQAAYAVACMEHQTKTISLIGPGYSDTRAVTVKIKRERGTTTDRKRLAQHGAALV